MRQSRVLLGKQTLLCQNIGKVSAHSLYAWCELSHDRHQDETAGSEIEQASLQLLRKLASPLR